MNNQSCKRERLRMVHVACPMPACPNTAHALTCIFMLPLYPRQCCLPAGVELVPASADPAQLMPRVYSVVLTGAGPTKQQ